MDFSEIRTRLDGLDGRAYWRSLDELAGTPEFQDFLHREFPAQASEFTDPKGRRDFLRLMGASIALAGATACTRQPAEKIIPYVRQPEEIVPGRPLFYATAMPMGGYGMPLLVESHMGRPTKTEGNPEHPASLGATDIYGQAAILDLYDPDRSRTILHRGDVSTWSAFVTFMRAQLAAQGATQGTGFRILSEPISSPTMAAQMRTLMETLPGARWHQWDPVFGVGQGAGTGVPQQASYSFDKADVIVSLDADFLNGGPASIRASKQFASRRRVDHPGAEMNRLYVAEPAMTVTGGKADHRLPMKARDIHAAAAALAGAVGGGSSSEPSNSELPNDAAKWIAAVAKDLQAHRGRSLVIAGDTQPAAVHALVRSMNQALGNAGATVTYSASTFSTPADGIGSLRELVGDMAAGRVEVLLILGGNPVFTAPADLGFAHQLEKVAVRAHLSQSVDETSALCHWHINEAHFLEAWGDIRTIDGGTTLIQPLIAPLYGGKSALEVIAALNGQGDKSGLDLVREHWTTAGVVTADPADKAWRKALHDGFITAGGSTGSGGSIGSTGSVPVPVPVEPTERAEPTERPALSGLEINFRPDPTILDGRFANNGWLQELPKPLTKITWDAVVYISPRTAERLGLANRDLVNLTYKGRSQEMPLWVQPGHADDSVTVHFGYGRTQAGRVGSNVGYNAFTLRTSDAPWFDGGLEIAKTGTYAISTTQVHHAMEERHPVRVVTKDQYAAHPETVHAFGHTPADDMTLYPKFEYTGYKWGMAIDTNTCTGCSVCIIACQSENNIAVVGKEQVGKGRELHWLRVDTYYAGNIDTPETYHQPVPCMQCENAPCEQWDPLESTCRHASLSIL